MKLILGKIFVSILAILTLNCSVEMPHPDRFLRWDGKDYVEDLSFNDIESIYELVTECWLDMKDHVPEQNDEDNDEVKPVNNINWIAISPYVFTLYDHKVGKQSYPPYIDHYHFAYNRKDSPPPDGLLAVC